MIYLLMCVLSIFIFRIAWNSQGIIFGLVDSHGTIQGLLLYGSGLMTLVMGVLGVVAFNKIILNRLNSIEKTKPIIFKIIIIIGALLLIGVVINYFINVR